MRIRKLGQYISGTGSAVPDLQITNLDLEASAPTNSYWVENVLGIKSRRFTSEKESLLSLCVKASNSALLEANLEIKDIQAIIIATSTPEFINPSMASLLHGELKALKSTIAFDLQAVCSGFLYALGIGAQFVNGSDIKNVLILGADQFSKITDFSKRECVFFGDGVGAAVLSYTPESSAFLSIDLYADNENWEGFFTPSHSQKFQMLGNLVKEKATQELPLAFRRILEDSNLDIDELFALFPHQPSKVVLDQLQANLNLKPNVLKSNLEFRGNTAGATVPLLLDEISKESPIPKNSLIGFAAIGSGWTWGVALTRWLKG